MAVYDVGNGQNGDPAACGESVPSTAPTATRPSSPKSLLNALSAYGPQLASLLALFFWTRPSSSANSSGLVSAVPEAPI